MHPEDHLVNIITLTEYAPRHSESCLTQLVNTGVRTWAFNSYHSYMFDISWDRISETHLMTEEVKYEMFGVDILME